MLNSFTPTLSSSPSKMKSKLQWICLGLACLLFMLASFWMFGTVVFPFVFDNGQCERQCQIYFNEGVVGKRPRKITGVWPLASRLVPLQQYNISELSTTRTSSSTWNTCACFETTLDGKTVELGTTSRLNSKTLQRDGSLYCGACSMPHDVQQSKELGSSGNFSHVITPCALSYVFFGHIIDRMCMATRANFTSECNSCIVKEHACIAVHCSRECMLSVGSQLLKLAWLNRASSVFSSTDQCHTCMEQFCAEQFAHDCGSNAIGFSQRLPQYVRCSV